MPALPIEKIVRRSDGRALELSTVAALAESIATVGLINPIRVRIAGDGYEVIAGAHRLEASKSLGLTDIDADIVAADDLHAELAMIDENLCRAELSPSDRASQTARRKAIYLELHPETGHGKATANKDDNLSSFASETAKASGRDERTVQRDAERGEKIVPAVLTYIAGTVLDTGVYMDKLKRVRGGEQMAMAKRDLAYANQQERERQKSGIARRIKTVVPLDDDDVREKQVEALMSAWNKASAEARQDFLARIDTPVFDRSAA
jgi:ParB family chromosome partitioning protein